MNTIAYLKVESVPVSGRTYIEVPGYDNKIPFGVMSSFAYCVDGSGNYDYLSDIFIIFKQIITSFKKHFTISLSLHVFMYYRQHGLVIDFPKIVF